VPEWYLVLAGLAGLAALGALWRPLTLALPLLVLGAALAALQAIRGASLASFPRPGPRRRRVALRALTAGLYMAQPLARLVGRLRHGLTPWRRRGRGPSRFVWPRTVTVWSEEWRPLEEWLGTVEARLQGAGAAVRRGAAHHRWDLEARFSLFGRVRLRTALEEHGAGRQLARFRLLPRPSYLATGLGSVAIGLAALAAVASAPAAAVVLACLGALVGGRLLLDLSAAAAEVRAAIGAEGASQSSRGT
jgi:O-antigen biosynthesis protein